jgi:hypothetical protein
MEIHHHREIAGLGQAAAVAVALAVLHCASVAVGYCIHMCATFTHSIQQSNRSSDRRLQAKTALPFSSDVSR